MARELSQEHHLEEMPSCLRELFEQTSSEHNKHFANNAHSSANPYKSVLGFSGMELPPPLLTEEERAEMRQYRREAVNCEAKMFERRRERYSNLLLQVMSVMDRIQEQRDSKTFIEEQYDNEDMRDRTLTKENDDTVSRTLHRNNAQPASYETDFDRRYAWGAAASNGRNSKQEQSSASFADWTESSNYHELSSRVNSQLDYLPESTNTNSVNQRGTYKHHGQLPRNGNSREQFTSVSVGFLGKDFPLSSTLDNETFEFKRPFPQLSVASNGNIMYYPGDEADTTLQSSSASFPDRTVLGSDSLASTMLSVAFSDSSTSTVKAAETQPARSATQQHRDSARKDNHYRDFDDQKSSQSTRQMTNHKTDKRPISAKQKAVKEKARLSNGPSVPDQDKTLANLEKLRQKLLEEKQKQLDALKQKELTRIRKQKKEQVIDLEHTYMSFHSDIPNNTTERPRSSSVPLTRQSDFKQALPEELESVNDRSSAEYHRSRMSPLRRPLSMPPGEMYSILELSGENLDFNNHNEDNIEPESSSDKENHVTDEVLRGNRNHTFAEDVPNGVTMRRNNGRQNMSPFSQRKEAKLLLPEGNDKFVSDGRDKFAKLSAHAKGFLTRVLMKTDKVQGLVKTIKDTRDVLVDISQEETQSVQEKKFKENVEGHLRLARGSLHDVFFTIPVKERMSYIAHSRAIARAKEAKRRSTRIAARQSKLSAVTLKAIQRRQGGLDNSVTQTTNSEVKPKPEPREEKKKKTWNIRVLKPQQGHTSPPLPDKTRSKKPNSRPATAPEKPLNSRLQKEDALKRPKTTETHGKPERPSRLSLGGGRQPANTHEKPEKPSRLSLGGGRQPANRPARKSIGIVAKQPKVTVQPRAQKRLSLPENAQPRIRAHITANDAMQRPKTASEVKRSSRTLAANFSN